MELRMIIVYCNALSENAQCQTRLTSRIVLFFITLNTRQDFHVQIRRKSEFVWIGRRMSEFLQGPIWNIRVQNFYSLLFVWIHKYWKTTLTSPVFTDGTQEPFDRQKKQLLANRGSRFLRKVIYSKMCRFLEFQWSVNSVFQDNIF